MKISNDSLAIKFSNRDFIYNHLLKIKDSPPPAEINTSFTYPNKTFRSGFSNILKNKSNKKIRVIDSFYDNNIVTDGFKVAGHFRWQPIGEGRQEKKLIWIEDFEKQGYTRIATKLKQ